MPLNWNITVSRLVNPPPSALSIDELPPMSDATGAQRIAVWQAGWQGLDWLGALVSVGQAVEYGNGYPFSYYVRAGDVRPHLANPPYENVHRIADAGDIVGRGWLGRTTIDHEAAETIEPGEWLHVTAWDES